MGQSMPPVNAYPHIPTHAPTCSDCTRVASSSACARWRRRHSRADSRFFCSRRRFLSCCRLFGRRSVGGVVGAWMGSVGWLAGGLTTLTRHRPIHPINHPWHACIHPRSPAAAAPTGGRAASSSSAEATDRKLSIDSVRGMPVAQ